MTQAVNTAAGPAVMDPYEIGWYIESADEDTYGPVARKTVRRFLQEQTISPNTLVRHCTQEEARPAVEQPVIMDGLGLTAAMLSSKIITITVVKAVPRTKLVLHRVVGALTRRQAIAGFPFLIAMVIRNCASSMVSSLNKSGPFGPLL